MKKTVYLISFLIMLQQTLKSQWQLGGNNAPPLNNTNNFLGSNGTNNTFIKLGVNSSQDIMIDNNPAHLLPGNGFGYVQGGHWIGLGRIFTPSAGPTAGILNPKAHLHIHGGNNTPFFGFTGGIRNWFNTGTLYTENSDGMYVGLRSLGSNQSYAVINWSDDAFGGIGTDYLSFNFTGGPNPLASSINGMELGRFSPTQFRGTLGVGNFQNISPGADPTRRVEILDADPASGTNANAPQLRLTYTYNANPIFGTYSEFQTTNAGDLYFNTQNSTAPFAARRFGFHTNTPGNTMEINSRPGVTGWTGLALSANGSSGLRFTNLTSASTPQANPGLGVLSVNPQGDVVYVPSSGLINANNGLLVNAGVMQLGGSCNNLAEILNARLLNDRTILLNNNNFWFADLNTNTGGIGVGGQPASTAFCNVGNTFEVSANNKGKYGNTNASGLRLTKLSSASPVLANGGPNNITNQKVLSVDKDGDVVLVAANSAAAADNGASTSGTNGNIHLGQNVAAAGNPGQLLNNREIPMNGFNIHFKGDASVVSEKVEVGDNTLLTTVSNRFNAQSKTVRVTGLFVNETPAGANPSNSTIGIAGFKLNGTSNNNIGVRGTGEVDPAYSGPGNPIGIGVKGEGHNTAQSVTNAMAIGVWGQSVNPAGQFNIGGFFDAGHQGGTNGMNVAIYGSVAPTASVNIAVYGTAAPAAFSATVPSGPFPVTGTYAGYFNGNVVRTGNDNFTSDKNLKQNIDSIQNAMSILNQLKPKTFDYKLASYPSMNLPSGKQYGLIAQEIELILPELVNNLAHPAQFDSLGVVTVPSFTYKSLEYQQLIPLLIRGIQEQQKVIDSLKTKTSKQDSINNVVQAQIAALTSSVSSCCSSTAVRNTKPEELNQLNIDLNDKDIIVLNQNTPNPFAEQTTITYNVPEKYGYAQIIFSTIEGRIIKTVDLTKKGRGQLNVFANDLGNGLYTYSLVVDGKVIDTKKMVKGE